MPHCPICFGSGHLDHRDSDAWFAEHHSDAELAEWETFGFNRNVGVLDCDECETTGIVSDDRLKDIMAAAVASVDQALARLQNDERPASADPSSRNATISNGGSGNLLPPSDS